MSHQEIYEVGEVPPIGHVPKQMYAQVIRAERFGDPRHAFKIEKIAVPEIRADEVLVYVMAAGVNFNNVWAALGSPVDVIARARKPTTIIRIFISAAATRRESSMPSATT